jgi:flagellin-like protein
MNKKGISPLIATVLIIGFTIVIAFLVITWMGGKTSDIMCQESCEIEGNQACSNFAGDLSLSSGDMVDLDVVNAGAQTFEFSISCYENDGSLISSGKPNFLNNIYTYTCLNVSTSFKVIPKVTPIIDDCEDCLAVTCAEIELTA